MKNKTDGKLRPKTQDEIDKKTDGWMHGLKGAFKKIRHNGILNGDDIKSLTRFIDEYTTVSNHENTVGKVVAKIVQEVNRLVEN